MNLTDLFVSHKRVEPVTFNPSSVSHTTPDIYSNRQRAYEVTNADNSSEDVSTWRVGGDDLEEHLPWKVKHVTIENPKIEEKVNPEIEKVDIEIEEVNPEPESVKIHNPKQIPIVTRMNNPYKNNRTLWISDMTNAYKKIGLGDNAIKNLLAKNALESGWGSSIKGDFNFGNITTGRNWTGRFVEANDKDAKGNRISQKFRSYDSLEDYVTDEIQFLTSLYGFNQNDDFDTFIGKLQGNNSKNRRYAEDPNYINLVRNVFNSI